MYNEESLKISKDPKLVPEFDLHPIYRYVPQNYTDMSDIEHHKKYEQEKINQMVASNMTFVRFGQTIF